MYHDDQPRSMEGNQQPRAVSVGMLKGGQAKTTTSLNLARELAHRNSRALVVDLDDNGHLTNSLNHTTYYESDVNHAERVLVDAQDPREYTVNVTAGLDLFPAHEDLEGVETQLKNAQMGTTRARKNLVDPLLGSEYDYVVFDCPANRGKLNDNAMYATGNLIIPLRPESGFRSGITNTANRLVREANQYFELEILAVVPSDLSESINDDRRDRELLEHINDPERPRIAERVPSFARLTTEDWSRIDDDYPAWRSENSLPGIRHRASIDKANDEGLPLRDYDPGCDQLACYGELARIVEQGEVTA